MILTNGRRISLFITILLLNCFLVINAFSQTTGLDSLKRKYETEAIWLDYPNYWKNGNKLPISQLKLEFTFSDRGRADYETGIKQIRASRYLNVASLGLLVASIFTIKQYNEGLTYGLIGGAVVVSTVSVSFNLRGRRNLERAIFNRNKDLLFPNQK